MIKLFKWFAIGLGVLLLVFIITGFLLPSRYSVERSLTINASPDRIHRLVGDLRRWPEWTPWTEMDPTITTTYGSTTTGAGASQVWSGESGGGELTFTQSDPLIGIDYEMSFDGEYFSDGVMRYEVTPTGTRVTWGMTGEMNNFIGRYMGLLMGSMVGPSFEAGLKKLKTAVESLPAMDSPMEEESGSVEAVG